MNRTIILLSLLASTACTEATTTCDDTDKAVETDIVDTDVVADTDVSNDDLTADELAAVSSWAAHEVTFSTYEGGPEYVGQRVTIRLAGAALSPVDVVTTLRATDHNSSRSNKTSSIAFDPNPLDTDVDTDGDTGGMPATFVPPSSLRWDGGDLCRDGSCRSGGRSPFGVSQLLIDPGTLSQGERMVTMWGETTPIDKTFTGYVALSVDLDHRGHVTVLKAADNGDGGVSITSNLKSDDVRIWSAMDNPMFQSNSNAGSNPLFTVAGTGGSSWPHGVAVEAVGDDVYVSLTW